MEVNVPDRDELGRFTSWAKKKGGEALDSIRKGAASTLENIGRGANMAADAVAPVEAPDEAEDLEAPSVTKAKLRMDRLSKPVGPAMKGKHKPWSYESKKGW